MERHIKSAAAERMQKLPSQTLMETGDAFPKKVGKHISQKSCQAHSFQNVKGEDLLLLLLAGMHILSTVCMIKKCRNSSRLREDEYTNDVLHSFPFGHQMALDVYQEFCISSG